MVGLMIRDRVLYQALNECSEDHMRLPEEEEKRDICRKQLEHEDKYQSCSFYKPNQVLRSQLITFNFSSIDKMALELKAEQNLSQDWLIQVNQPLSFPCYKQRRPKLLTSNCKFIGGCS